MKTNVKVMIAAGISLFLMSCKGTNPPSEAVPGLESVNGTVTNEAGDVLEGVKIEAYYDEQLTELFPDNNWYAEYGAYTDSDGRYSISQVSRGGVDSLDVYVVATDSSGLYLSQTQKGQIKYGKVLGVEGYYKYSGEAIVNFVLKAKLSHP